MNNIFIENNTHKYFKNIYSYSEDFLLLRNIVSTSDANISIKIGSISKNSPGGVSDLNRLSIINERLKIIAIYLLKEKNYLMALLTSYSKSSWHFGICLFEVSMCPKLF